MALRVLITGCQSGVVARATSTSPGLKVLRSFAEPTTRTLPLAIFVADGLAGDDDLGLPPQPIGFDRGALGRRERGLGRAWTI